MKPASHGATVEADKKPSSWGLRLAAVLAAGFILLGCVRAVSVARETTLELVQDHPHSDICSCSQLDCSGFYCMHGNPCCMSFRNQDKDGDDVRGSHEACFCRCELNWVQSRFVPVKGREKDTDPWKNANAAPCDRCKWNWMTGPFAEQACAAVQDEPIHHGGTYGYDSPNLKCGPGTRYVPDAEDLLTDAVINKCSPECTICKEGNCNIDGTCESSDGKTITRHQAGLCPGCGWSDTKPCCDDCLNGQVGFGGTTGHAGGLGC